MTDHMKAAITRLQDSADDITGWLSDFQDHAPYGKGEAITFHRLDGSIDLRHAIEEILPHIRAMVAQEILDHADDIPLNGLLYRDGIYAGMVSAALLVEGQTNE